MKKAFTLLSLLAITSLANAQNLQGTMETWQTYMVGFPIPTIQLEKPAGWRAADSLICALGPFIKPGGNFKKQLFKSTSYHGGAYAALLINRDQDTLGIAPGLLTNATIEVDLQNQTFNMVGGTPVTLRIDTVKAWVKYVPKGVDEGSMAALAVLAGAGAGGTDSVVGSGIVTITANSSYHEIMAVLSYPNNVTPNALQVTFTGSTDIANAADSTELYVDDVTAVGTVGIKMHLFESPVVEVYPNPAVSKVYINNTGNETLSWELYSVNGAKVLDVTSVKGKTETDISPVAAGNYIYQVKNKDGDIVQTGKLSVTK